MLEEKHPEEKLTFFYKTFYHHLLGIARQKMKDYHLAEDMVSETFLISMRYQDRLDPKKPEAAFVYYRSILQSCCVNYFRKHKQELSLNSLKELAEDETEPIAGENSFERNPLERLMRKEEKGLASTAIDKLGEKEQKAIQMFFFEGRTYREIAEAAGITVNEVGVVLHRAKKKLKKELTEHS